MNALRGIGASIVPMIVVATIVVAGCRETAAPAAAEPAAPPIAAAPAAPTPPPVASPPPIERSPVVSEKKDADNSAACLAKTADHAAQPASAIHTWVDAAGVTHYSDQAPTTQVSGDRVLEVTGLPPVKIEASGYDVNLPTDLERRAIVDALAVQRVFHDVLGIDAPADTVLHIVFVGDAAAYQKLIGDTAPAGSAGAYVPDRHTIYVRMQPDEETSFSILRHEITHALIHEEVGNLPVTLNEGLAEYFRRYRAAGMGGQVDLGADRNGLRAAAPSGAGSDALVDLLALSGPDFYAGDRERRYFEAYALVAVLMRGGEATAALHDVLAGQRQEPCVPVRVEAVIDARYPGGLAGLAHDWAALLREPPASVRAY
ncbi:MAG TPA: DUF4124 domain-containing protein [Rhodanobacteraceae bacterium]|nr:DUF4124 domain-containing protein [Rhodanobacteraceae bacterium]